MDVNTEPGVVTGYWRNGGWLLGAVPEGFPLVGVRWQQLTVLLADGTVLQFHRVYSNVEASAAG